MQERLLIHAVIDDINSRLEHDPHFKRKLIFQYPSQTDFEEEDLSTYCEFNKSHSNYEGLDQRKMEILTEILEGTPKMWFNRKTVQMYATVCRCSLKELSVWMYNYRINQQMNSQMKGVLVRDKVGTVDTIADEDIDYMDYKRPPGQKLSLMNLSSYAQDISNKITAQQYLRTRFGMWPLLREGESKLLEQAVDMTEDEIIDMYSRMFESKKLACELFLQQNKPPGLLKDDPDYQQLVEERKIQLEQEKERARVSINTQIEVGSAGNIVIRTSLAKSSLSQ